MLRRRHKKSKKGCEQCKRRHVKCDEGQPTCRLCTLTDRKCSFSSLDLPSPPSTSTSLPSPDPNHASTSTSSPTPTSVENVVNMEHMELFVHLITNRDLFSLGDTVKDYKATLDVCIKKSVEAPYLLHQMLAFSARHLAVIHPDRSTHYLEQAMSLQTRAVSLFNATRREVDSSNCVPILLFSVNLGHHLLADALAYRGSDGLYGFLEYYTYCVDLNRGIYNVAASTWPLLVQSEIEPVLSWGRKESAKEPTGTECAPISKLIDDSITLEKKEKEVCHSAIKYLQVGFDAMFSGEEGARYRMIFQWTMLASPEFRSLLSERKPEALILLSYYALLLHYGRRLWQVGNAGEYLIGVIRDYLGPEWHFRLEYPSRMIRETV